MSGLAVLYAKISGFSLDCKFIALACPPSGYYRIPFGFGLVASWPGFATSIGAAGTGLVVNISFQILLFLLVSC